MKHFFDMDFGSEMSDPKTVFPNYVYHADYSKPTVHDKKRLFLPREVRYYCLERLEVFLSIRPTVKMKAGKKTLKV